MVTAKRKFVTGVKSRYIPKINRNFVLSKLSNDAALKMLGVVSLKLFGSAARDAARAGSDVDFLVRFSGTATYDRYLDLKFHLEEVLGVRVDLVTEDALRPEMRQAVEKDALLVA
jgi:uncharacterized protein